MVFLGLRLLSFSSSLSTVKIRHPRLDKRKPSSSSSRSETWWGSPSQLLSSNVNSLFSVSGAFSFTSDTLASLSTFSILHCAHLLLAASFLVNSLNWLPMWSFQSPMPMATWKNLTTIRKVKMLEKSSESSTHLHLGLKGQKLPLRHGMEWGLKFGRNSLCGNQKPLLVG